MRSEKERMSVSRRFRIGKEGGQIEKKKGVLVEGLGKLLSGRELLQQKESMWRRLVIFVTV